MYGTLGLGWGNSLLAFITLLRGLAIVNRQLATEPVQTIWDKLRKAQCLSLLYRMVAGIIRWRAVGCAQIRQDTPTKTIVHIVLFKFRQDATAELKETFVRELKQLRHLPSVLNQSLVRWRHTRRAASTIE
ncbi:hypothetical protein LMH87_011006 [Akanthomyces muscarius]|uniref:Stress-response A/B barrel domain-containing protein n=1 Tax=Akanthomyces muscarius TaxID=2231603 RepID=A0A9W8QAW3_AKAMU|nr:hypothetical protein LMH87_011006 [Akanthomyces muscarius]KAJ4150248.1 hypothetical protein LMH87_011006 [Akanthomyces muscarius]